MRLTRLKADGFKSYLHVDLDLSKATACSIIGSNGAGKSTLAEAIIWVLFSYTQHNSVKELLHPEVDKLSVELWFTIDDREYHVVREYHNGSMSATATVNGRSMSQYASGIAPAMVQAIGTSRELVAESVIIQQGQLSSFIKATSAQRRDLIMSMLGLDKYSKAWEIAKESHKTMLMTVASHDQSLDTIGTELKKLPDVATTEAAIATMTAELTTHTDKVQKLINDKQSLLARHQQATTAIAEYNEQANALKSRIISTSNKMDVEIAKHRQYLNDANAQIANLSQLVQSLIELEGDLKHVQELESQTQELKVKVNDVNVVVASQRTKISVAATSEEVCPLCGNHLTKEKWAEIVNGMQTELATLVASLTTMHQQLNGIHIIKPSSYISTEMDQVKARLTKLEMMQESKGTLAAQIERLVADKDATIADLKGQLEHVTEKLAGMDQSITTEFSLVEHELKQEQNTHAAISAKLSDWVASKKARDTLDKSMADVMSMAKLAKEKLPEIEFVASALSPSGIPLMLIDHYLPLVEAKANELLYIMSDGFLNVKLVVTDGKKVELMAGSDHLRLVKGLSGGEQTRVSLALRLALSQVLFDMTGCKFDCLLIDEPEYLDPAGVSQFVGAVNNLRSLFPQIFVISHLDQIKSAFPQSIVVEKKGNTSTAVLKT